MTLKDMQETTFTTIILTYISELGMVLVIALKKVWPD